MGLTRKTLRGLGRRAADKVMDRVGGRLVSRIADTSSDAPSAFHKPKRDVYRHMTDGKLAVPPDASQTADPSAAPAATEPGHTDSHSHSHSHSHNHDDDDDHSPER